MANRKKTRTSGEIAHHRANTRRNKIKAINKALLTAKGKGITELNKRLEFWKNNK